MAIKNKKIDESRLFNIENEVSKQAKDEIIPNETLDKNLVMTNKMQKAKKLIDDVSALETQTKNAFLHYDTLNKKLEKMHKKMQEAF